jgi:hypothetical protein
MFAVVASGFPPALHAPMSADLSSLHYFIVLEKSVTYASIF